MEVTSVLAGERWTDAPRCTHPLLAAVARLVNDELGDERRQVLSQVDMILKDIGKLELDRREE